MKKIIVACGSGVATSQTVASKVNRLLKENKVDAQVEAVDLKSVDRYMDSSVAYIAITKIDKEYPIPVINGIAFLTGVGQDAELKKLIEKYRCVKDTEGMSPAKVYKMVGENENLYLKMTDSRYKGTTYDVEREKDMMLWLEGKLPVPKVLHFERHDGWSNEIAALM